MTQQPDDRKQAQSHTNITGDVHGPVYSGSIGQIGDRTINYYYLYGEIEEAISPLPYEPETVVIPAGPFVMGYDHGERHEAPQHRLADFPEYRIGKYPVTNRQYLAFVRQTRRVAGSSLRWHGNTPPSDRLDYPVTGVTWAAQLTNSLSWWTVAGGGGDSAAGSFRLRGSVGQVGADAMTGGVYALQSGFWQVAAATASFTPTSTATPAATATATNTPSPGAATATMTPTATATPTATPGTGQNDNPVYLPLIQTD